MSSFWFTKYTLCVCLWDKHKMCALNLFIGLMSEKSWDPLSCSDHICILCHSSRKWVIILMASHILAMILLLIMCE